MIFNPKGKSVTYSIAIIADVEISLDEIEKQMLENNKVDGLTARIVCGELNQIRDSLSLKRGVCRHEKWAVELQSKDKPDLASFIAAEIFKHGNISGDDVSRIQYITGRPSDEKTMGGLCEDSLATCIRAAILKESQQ